MGNKKSWGCGFLRIFPSEIRNSSNGKVGVSIYSFMDLFIAILSEILDHFVLTCTCTKKIDWGT